MFHFLKSQISCLFVLTMKHLPHDITQADIDCIMFHFKKSSILSFCIDNVTFNTIKGQTIQNPGVRDIIYVYAFTNNTSFSGCLNMLIYIKIRTLQRQESRRYPSSLRPGLCRDKNLTGSCLHYTRGIQNI